MNFDKYIVMTSAEIDGLATSVLSLDPPLPSQGGRKMSDLFGKKSEYNSQYHYSVDRLEEIKISNETHPDFGKYAVKVSAVDVNEHASSFSARLVDYDKTWKL